MGNDWQRTGQNGEGISVPRREPPTDARDGRPYSNGSSKTEPEPSPPGLGIKVEMYRPVHFRADFPSSALGLKAGIGPCYLYLCCIAYCEMHHVSIVPEIMIRTLADWSEIGKSPKEVAEMAVDAGLLARFGDGYAIGSLTLS